MSAESSQAPRCLLILGMHRSGTSALTRCLNLVGMDVGPNLLVPDGGNSKGYWEHADAVRINESLLEALGLSWWSLDPMPEAWLSSSAAATARGAIESLVKRDFTGIPLWGIKDPRMCRVAPLWIDVINRMGIEVSAVFVARSPREVARSIARAHGLTEQAGVLSWLQYTAESERATREVRRAMVSYDQILEAPAEMLLGLATNLPLHWPISPRERERALVAFVDTGLRSHKNTDVGSPVPAVVDRMQHACDVLASANDPGHWADLSVISDEVEELFKALAFRVKALLPDEAEWAHQVNLAKMEQASAMLYPALPDATYSEIRGISRPVSMSRKRLSFGLDETPIGVLRLDPSDRAGCYVIHDVAVLDVEGNTLWSWKGSDDDNATLVNMERLGGEAGSGPVFLCHEDPQIHLALPWGEMGPVGAVILDIERLNAARVVQVWSSERTESARHRGWLREAQLALDKKDRDFRIASQEADDRLRDSLEEQRKAYERDLELIKIHADEALESAKQHAMDLEQVLRDELLLSGQQAALRESELSQRLRIAESEKLELQLSEQQAALRESELSQRLRLAESEKLELQLSEQQAALRESELSQRLRLAESEKLELLQIQQQLAALSRNQNRHTGMTQILLRRGILNRLRRRFSEVKVGIEPRHQLELMDAGAGRYRVLGDDPIFACESDRFPLAPGWYIVTLHLEQHNGAPVRPCFYPDYGPEAACGPAGEPMLFVRPGQSTHRGLIRFTHPVRALRFDPATMSCEFSLSSLNLRRISKLSALHELFNAWRQPIEVLGKPRPAWREILRSFMHSGLSGGASMLYQWYTVGDPRENSYDSWVALYDDISPSAIRAARDRSESWTHQPRISILVPTYNTDEQWLRKCVESVLGQAYANWELCIADDASPKTHVMRVLQELAEKDDRIRVVRREANGHISASSNTALHMATGEYVALLDHDDELHPLALHHVVSSLQQNPQWKLIYSDEDKIDEHGRRYDPYMKPDWNHDLFLSQNCISHLGVYQRQLVLDVGGFREGYEGSQDWDLALRCIERLVPGEIGHVPRVLYHWRAIAGSTAVGVGEKSYARTAGFRAVSEHLERVGANALVREHKHAMLKGHFHISYRLPERLPRVSLIIPTRDGLHLLRQCVDSIISLTEYDNYEIVIVDNQSVEEETKAYFASVVADSRVRVLAYDQPFNYSAINNYAIRQTTGDLVGLINNDIEVISPGWLREMAGHAMRPEIGAVGAMLYYPNDTIQHAGVVTGFGGVAGHVNVGYPRGYIGQMGRAQLTQNFTAVTAACLVIRRSIVEEINGLDESLKVAFNDVDFCLRVRQKGYRNLWTPLAELYHHESATRGYEDSPEKVARFAGEVNRMRELWGELLDMDPAYNPNLSLHSTPFELAFPPRGVH